MKIQIIRIILVLLIPLALCEAWYLVPSRDDGYKQMDFAVFYAAGRMFAHGQNPYDRAGAEDTWINAGGDDDVMNIFYGQRDDEHPADHWLPIEVIPPGLAVFTIFSIFKVGFAWGLWTAVVGLLLLGQLYATARLMRRPLWDIASLLMILFVILLEPLHVGLANGQPTVPTISLLILALWLNTINRQTLAGIAFAIATALKPQLAAPFVILFIYQGKWRTVCTAAIVGLVLTIAAVIPMQLHHPDWLSVWTSEVRYAELAGGIDDARVANLGRNDLLHFSLLGHLITDNAFVVNAISFTVFVSLLSGLFYLGQNARESLVVLAAFCAIALLPMYHRFYDAGILALAAGWAVCNLKDRTLWPAVLVLVGSCAYLAPEEWLMVHFRNAQPGQIARWWFNTLAEPHHTWEILLIIAGLLVSLVPADVFNRQTLRTHGLRIAMAALIPLAVCEAWTVAPDRDWYKEMDFAMYYTAGRMYVHGVDPYDRAKAEDMWDQADGDYEIMDFVLGPNTFDEEHPGDHWLPINLIPTALVVTAPFALFPVPIAWPAWNVVIALLLAGQAFAVIKLMGKPFWHPATLGVITLTILMDPLHIGLANGQPAVPAVSLIVIAIWLARINWQIAAGIALAIATALKPQLAGVFVVYFLWQRQYKTVGVALAVGLLLTLIAIVPMQLHGIPWASSWSGEVKYAERPGGINDPRVANVGRHDMIHLPLVLHFLSDNAFIVNALSLIVVAVLGAWLMIKTSDHRTELGPLAAFATLALLPVYHRWYDAGILVLMLAWVTCNITGKFAWQAAGALICFSGFFLTQAWLEDAFTAMEKHPALVNAWWFNLMVIPHKPLELLGVFVCIMLAITKKPATVVGVDAMSSDATPELAVHI